GARRQDRLCLHRAARTARDDARPALQQTARTRPSHRDRPADRAVLRSMKPRPGFQTMLQKAKSAERKSTDSKPAEHKPAEPKPTAQKSVERKSIERKPTAFGDMRGWIGALKAQDELTEIAAEVDWNLELGTIMRLAQGPGTGKALIFNNIKDYNGKAARCRRVFGSSLNSYRRIAMMLGLPPDTHPRELVKIRRTTPAGSIPPKIVTTGPVKQNILTGKDIDLYQFPAPWWNRLDGGRYLLTYGGCVTKDPETGVMNVGVYRGMVASRD